MSQRARDLLRKLSNRELKFRAQPFITPYTSNSSVAVVPMEKSFYRFRISGFQGSGIGKFQPTSPNHAVYEKEAEFDEARLYLNALPQLHLILIHQVSCGWFAFPMHLPMAREKFGIQGEVIVHNVSDAQRFDVITSRWDGQNLWYDELFAGADPIKSANMRDVFQNNVVISDKVESASNLRGTSPEDVRAFCIAAKAWEDFVEKTTEDIIKELLENGGAKLGSYVDRGASLEISWQSQSGGDYTSLVSKDTLDVVSAGICLSGGDKDFHLKDLPHIIRDGERQRLIYRTRGSDYDDWDE